MSQILERGVAEIIEKEHLMKRIEKGDKLRVKLGIDPTAKDLHLGHSVVLRKLRDFQKVGHHIILIIGDFTAAIGDPSGRNELRPVLTDEEIKINMKNYLKEAGKIIDIGKTEIRHNSEWYNDKKLDFFMELSSKFTVARSLERDDFQKRLKDNRDISVLELLYPIIQGYDSVAIMADVELGGTDQKFNLLTGRKVQKRYGQPEQDIVTSPLIEGLDGVKKMSKSLGNYIGLSEKPTEMFNKIMSIPDDLMVKYFTLLTDISENEIERLKKDRLNPSLASQSPIDWKKILATEIVKIYHGEKEAQRAKKEFEKVFSDKQTPEDIQELRISGNEETIIDGLCRSGLVGSKTEAKRLVSDGAVDVNSATIKEWDYKLKAGDIIKVGAHRFLKVI